MITLFVSVLMALQPPIGAGRWTTHANWIDERNAIQWHSFSVLNVLDGTETHHVNLYSAGGGHPAYHMHLGCDLSEGGLYGRIGLGHPGRDNEISPGDALVINFRIDGAEQSRFFARCRNYDGCTIGWVNAASGLGIFLQALAEARARGNPAVYIQRPEGPVFETSTRNWFRALGHWRSAEPECFELVADAMEISVQELEGRLPITQRFWPF